MILAVLTFLVLGTAAAWGEVGTAIRSLPYTITDPGYYYVTGDLTSSGHGIIVSGTGDVTIDLRGFTITGAGLNGTYGIHSGDYGNVEIRNGAVRYFSAGVTTNNISTRVMNLRVEGNSSGIGGANVVKDCTVYNNGTGINSPRTGSLVTGNTVFNNASGISASSGAIVTANTAYNNSDNGISAGDGSTVSGNTSFGNNNGISAGVGSTVTGNTAKNNQCAGIVLSGNSLVVDNTAYNNDQSGAGGSCVNMSSCPTCTFGLNHAP
jgi:parallel beta-helix repeat protein